VRVFVRVDANVIFAPAGGQRSNIEVAFSRPELWDAAKLPRLEVDPYTCPRCLAGSSPTVRKLRTRPPQTSWRPWWPRSQFRSYPMRVFASRASSME
jgi:hypothetical protein